MNRIVLGAVSALLFAGAGLFWWQGRAETEHGAPPPQLAGALATPEGLPSADTSGLRGDAPPEASEATREQRRFDRLDRDRDSRVTRNEMLAPRAEAFRKLDADHNNLLTFEEWAVRTANRFKSADANGDGALNRPEFATTKPKRAAQPQCRCAPARPAPTARHRPAARRTEAAPPPEPVDDSAEGEEPAL